MKNNNFLAPYFFVLSIFFGTFYKTTSHGNKLYISNTLSGSTYFGQTLQNTTCTGGTVTDIYMPAADENEEYLSYVLTLKELSASGFEDISKEEAERIIITLSQLSSLSYHVLINE